MDKKIKNRSAALFTAMIIASNGTFVFANDIEKDETVYTILDSNGKVNKNIVSTWIKSDSKLGKFSDTSSLTNIKNLKGDEKPVIDGNKITWDVDKEDLYYRGETNKQLPISVDIKYELDGKIVNPEEIEGKSGDVKITIKLNNNESRAVDIKGEYRTIYVPFLTATEVVMPRENFKNIKSNEGKILDDGKNSSITFASLPGLKESLNIGSDLIDILNLKDTLVIEGKATNFKMPNIMVAASPEVGEIDKLDKDSSFGDLKKSIDDLQKGADALLDGTEKLSKGTSELNEKYKLFNNGVKTLDSGVGQLSQGIDKLGSSAPLLSKGASDLSNGLNQLSTSQDKFTAGVAQYIGSAKKLYGAYEGIDKGIESAAAGSAQLKDGFNQGTEGLDRLIKSTDNVSQVAGGLDEISSQVAAENPELAAKLKGLSGNLNSISSQQRAGLESVKSGLGSAKAGVSSLNDGLAKLDQGSSSFYENFKKFNEAGTTLADSSSKLKSATDTIYTGSKDLANGNKQLEAGSQELLKGGKTLKSGSSELSSNSDKILSATEQLKEGSNKLYEGTKKMENEVLNKMLGSKNISEIEGALEAKDKIIEASKDYNNFSGISEEMQGNVKFIMRTKNEEKEETKKKVEKVEEDKGIIDWIKNLVK